MKDKHSTRKKALKAFKHSIAGDKIKIDDLEKLWSKRLLLSWVEG